MLCLSFRERLFHRFAALVKPCGSGYAVRHCLLRAAHEAEILSAIGHIGMEGSSGKQWHDQRRFGCATDEMTSGLFAVFVIQRRLFHRFAALVKPCGSGYAVRHCLLTVANEAEMLSAIGHIGNGEIVRASSGTINGGSGVPRLEMTSGLFAVFVIQRRLFHRFAALVKPCGSGYAVRHCLLTAAHEAEILSAIGHIGMERSSGQAVARSAAVRVCHGLR